MASKSPLLSHWHPDTLYDFTLRIGESDYSTDLIRVEIRSAVSLPYQHIFLDIYMDPRDILSKEFFGQQPLKLIVRLKGKEPSGYGNDIEFDLMYINTEGEFAPAQQSYMTDQWERSIVRLKTVCSKPYQTMSKMVNNIYFNATPNTIISDLISNTAELNYDTLGRSKLAIDQLLIPPTTIYRVVKYLDRTYGVFDGTLGFHCSFDNKVKVQNLTTKVRDAQTFTLYLLATDRKDNEKDVFKDRDENEAVFFYTTSAVNSAYQGNSIFAASAPTRRYIVKPRNTLYKNIDINLQSFSKKYGVIEKNNDSIYYNIQTIDPEKRISYHKDQTGYDTNQTFINANLSSRIVDMATLSADIQGNLPVLNLMQVGEHVKVISHVDDHLKLGGAYILKGSNIQFMKSRTWEAGAKIYLSRTNIAMQ
jgi:hypothetical protein